MKHTIKIAFYLLSFIAIFVVSSCERNLYEDKMYQSKLKIENVSLKDNSKLKTKINPNIFKAISKIKKAKQNIASKIIYDTINNIYFDDELGIKITKEDYEAYVFKIIKEGGKLENLVFSKNILGEFDMYKIKYKYTEEELSQFADIEQREKLKEFTMLNLQTNFSRDIAGLCFYSYDDDIEEGGIMAPRHFKMIYVIDVDCLAASSGGGGSGGDGGDSGGDGSAGTGSVHGPGSGGNSSEMGAPISPPHNYTPPIITTPVHGNQTSPCIKMKKLLTDINLRARLNNLKVASEQFSFEQLIVVNPNPNPTASNNYNYVQFNGTINAPTAVWSGDTTMKGMLHSHYDGLLSVFSPTDLQTLYNIMNNSSVTDDFFYGVTTKAGTRYIMTMENRDNFLAFGSKYLANDKDFLKFEEKLWQTKYNIQAGNNMADHNEKAFTKNLNSINNLV